MKGRNSVVVSIRLPDSVYAILKERAKDLSVSEHIKRQILRSVNKPVNTIDARATHQANGLPLYNPQLHKAGERVLVKKGGRLIEAIVPEIDADEQVMR